MPPERPTDHLQNTQFRQEFPFVRPRLKLSHFIPIYGAISYTRELQKIKGQSVSDVIKDMKGAKLKEFLSLGVSTWPDPKTSKEAIEAGKTALQNGAFVAYHTLVTYVGVNEVVKLLFSAKEKGV